MLFRPRIIELVGIAGAGKSTLRQALRQHNEKIQIASTPNKIAYVPTFLKIAFIWFPHYLRKYRDTRWFNSQEIRLICYLETFLSHIRSQNMKNDGISILDPGSVCWLAALQEFGPALMKYPIFQQWWVRKQDEWFSALDVIIWLEVPRDLSLQRIQTREQYHIRKFQSPEIALDSLERMHLWYEKLVFAANQHKNIKIFHYDTSNISTEKIVDELFSTMDI